MVSFVWESMASYMMMSWNEYISSDPAKEKNKAKTTEQVNKIHKNLYNMVVNNGVY